MSQSSLVLKFTKEVKKRVEMKTQRRELPEKFLLKQFQYYDYAQSGRVQFGEFWKVMTLKLGLNQFSDSQVMKIYEYYSNILGNKEINYRDFIDYFYDVKKSNRLPRTQEQSTTKSFTNNKNDIYDESKAIKKMIEQIIYSCRKRSMASSSLLYKDMRISFESDPNDFDVHQLNNIFKKHLINFDLKDLQRFYDFFSEESGIFLLDKLWDCICVKFNSKRQNKVGEMFSQLDIHDKKFITLNLLYELYNPRNHIFVKEGRMTINEVVQGFQDFLDSQVEILAGEIKVTKNQFIEIFKYISPFFEHQKHFFHFIDNSFRYNELRKIDSYQKKVSMSRINQVSQRGNERQEIMSVRTDLQPHNVMLTLEEQIDSKGDRGYINLYKSFKNHDYDKDDCLFEKEWFKVLKEQRIYVKEEQAKALFNNFKETPFKMNYMRLLIGLIPELDSGRIQDLRDLHQEIMEGSKTNQISFFDLEKIFDARKHPDISLKQKMDYEIKEEFFSALKDFLILYQGNFNYVTQDSLMRFFEFYARNWNDQYFKTVVYSCFMTKKRKRMNQGMSVKSYPYGTDYDMPSEKQKTQQLYEEFQKKKFSKKNSPEEEEISKKENLPLRERSQLPERSAKTKSRINRKTKRSERPPSPDNGSIISQVTPQKVSVYELNKQIQDKMVKEEHRVYDNVNQNELGKNTPVGKFTSLIKKQRKIISLLEMEYEMTNRSDTKGVINGENFENVFEVMGWSETLNRLEIKAIYDSKLNDQNQLHVQTFANEIRDQMSEERENIVIDLFDRLCQKFNSNEIVSVQNLRNCFQATKFSYSSEQNLGDISEMYQYLIDLFVCLNLQIKNQNYLDMDDFLYFFDNFSFFIEDDKIFKKMTEECFR